MTKSNKIKGTYPLQVDEIRFTDGAVLKNKTIMFCNGFIVVEVKPGEPPSMFNMNCIEELCRVQEIKPEMSVSVTTW